MPEKTSIATLQMELAARDKNIAALEAQVKALEERVWAAEVNADEAAELYWEGEKELDRMLEILEDGRLRHLLSTVLRAQKHRQHVRDCKPCQGQQFEAQKRTRDRTPTTAKRDILDF